MTDTSGLDAAISRLRTRRDELDRAIANIEDLKRQLTEQVARCEPPVAVAPAPTPTAPDEPAAPASEIKVERPPPVGIGTTNDQVWRFVAKVVSQTGVSPLPREIAEHIGRPSTIAYTAINWLCKGGYFEREESYALIRVLRWPPSVTPRETESPRAPAPAPVVTTPKTEPVPQPVIAAAPPPSLTGQRLTTSEERVWEALARQISTTGLSIPFADLAERAGVAWGAVPPIIDTLGAKGFIRKSGNRRTTLLHVLKWPEGVDPRETSGRTDRPDMVPSAKAPSSAGGAPKRRFDHAGFDPTSVMALTTDHPAMLEKRTLFPSTVKTATESPRLLVSGANQRKLGDRVTKGAWKGMPIYALTLEERATCPKDCHHLSDCYGNSMQWARRHRDDGTLRVKLYGEVADLAAAHPDGFVVRLHVLGDFYSIDYVMQWRQMIEEFPALHVFGYTAWKSDTPIGLAVDRLREQKWDRFAIRRSSAEPLPMGATTIARRERGQVPEGLVCPAQSEPGVCCGSCGLCWHPRMKDKTIVFMMHGRRGKAVQLVENGCSTPGCKGPRQPGRDKCATCLRTGMPPNPRVTMRVPLSGASGE